MEYVYRGYNAPELPAEGDTITVLAEYSDGGRARQTGTVTRVGTMAGWMTLDDGDEVRWEHCPPPTPAWTPDARIETRTDNGEWHTTIESADTVNRDYLKRNPDQPHRLTPNEPARPAIGTAWVDPADGTVYRLRGYYLAASLPLSAGPREPAYSCLLPTGSQTSTRELPAAAVLIWTPQA